MKHRLHDRAENPEMWASKINEPGLFKKKKKIDCGYWYYSKDSERKKLMSKLLPSPSFSQANKYHNKRKKYSLVRTS